MSFYTRKTMRRALAPQHKISCTPWLWWKLIRSLRKRGANGSRESGAFLLGHSDGSSRRIVDFVLYDDLDPKCLRTGIVRFDGRYFSDLWAHCKFNGLAVVADIHVHPGEYRQSTSDKNHPMITAKDHIAMILPKFAKGRQSRSNMGIFVYQGAKTWTDIPSDECRRFFYIGIWG